MKGIDFVDQVRRDKAGDDTEDRTEEGQELQDRCIEDDGAPGDGDGEDEDAVTDDGLADFFFRNEAAQDVHSNPLAGFTEAEEDAEESRHDSEDVEDKAEDLDGAAIKPSGNDGQGRNVLGVSEDGLVMTLHPAVARNHHQATFDRFGADVGGDVSAGDDVTCGNIGGSVQAGDSVHCTGDVLGNVRASDSVTCGDISGSVSAERVRCTKAGGEEQESFTFTKKGKSFSFPLR